MATDSARSRKSQRAASRGWVRLSLFALGVALIAGSAGTWLSTWITDPTRLPLKTVRITGELAHLDRGRLQELVAAAIDGGFFSVDMRKLRAAAEQLAWVDEVSIRRVWPQTLVMHVTEQQPVARWGDDALVNASGEVFRPETRDWPEGLPQLAGSEADAPRVVAFQRLADARLASAGMRITGLLQRGRHDWQLELDSGISLLLDQANAASALDEFVAALPAIRDPQGRRPARVDMRYENGFAVRWAPAADAHEKSQQRGDA